MRYGTPVEVTGLKTFFDLSRRVCLPGCTVGGIDYSAGLNEPNLSNPEFNVLRFITIKKKEKKQAGQNFKVNYQHESGNKKRWFGHFDFNHQIQNPSLS